jgi:hypothetical protein
MLLYLACSLAGYSASVASSDSCDYATTGERHVYWGDLHVHTAFSLDAYAFGTRHDPGDAFAFAQGQELLLADGVTRIALTRPLDFAAVTDHAETFDTMYLCTDPLYLENSYCRGLRQGSGGQNLEASMRVFRDYLLTALAGNAPPNLSRLCDAGDGECEAAGSRQWRRAQEYANAANRPCDFTAFVANEWSATPGTSHWHRNLIFKSSAVTRQAIDYLRFPTLEKLWGALDSQCLPSQGCDVIAIPHNSNLAEGGGFDVEKETENLLHQRAKYERLMEIHQIKGNSECLPTGDEIGGDEDCGFEILVPAQVAGTGPVAAPDRARLELLGASYGRSLLKRGLLASQRESSAGLNPLQLGFVGSTDSHRGTPGAVDETNWKGDTRGWGDSAARRLQNPLYNPGGLVAVWAEENTRESLFSALKRRETYATSGPRIGLKFQAHWGGPGASCEAADGDVPAAVMGGLLPTIKQGRPLFRVLATADKSPLSRVEIIKGTVIKGVMEESVIRVSTEDAGRNQLCATWVDKDFDPEVPAFWYARVLEIPTPRWSKLDCEKLGSCLQMQEADKMIRERAWSSPIWYSPPVHRPPVHR